MYHASSWSFFLHVFFYPNELECFNPYNISPSALPLCRILIKITATISLILIKNWKIKKTKFHWFNSYLLKKITNYKACHEINQYSISILLKK